MADLIIFIILVFFAACGYALIRPRKDGARPGPASVERPCPRCKAPNQKHAEFCARCGERLSESTH